MVSTEITIPASSGRSASTGSYIRFRIRNGASWLISPMPCTKNSEKPAARPRRHHLQRPRPDLAARSARPAPSRTPPAAPPRPRPAGPPAPHPARPAGPCARDRRYSRRDCRPKSIDMHLARRPGLIRRRPVVARPERQQAIVEMQAPPDLLAPQPLDDLGLGRPLARPGDRRQHRVGDELRPLPQLGQLRRRLHRPQPLQHAGGIDEPRAPQPRRQHRLRVRGQEPRLDRRSGRPPAPILARCSTASTAASVVLEAVG